MTTDTSTESTGATPAPSAPAMGTTAPAGATPQRPAITLEEALAKIADLEHSTRNATEERDRHRKKLSAYEEQERKAQELALSEVDKATKRAADAEQKNQRLQQELVNATVRLAAKDRGIIDPDMAAMALSKKDQAWTLEYDEDGTPTNLDKALDALIKHKAYLVPKSEPAEPTPTTPAQTAPAQQRPAAIPAMNPGRASIASPGSFAPGKIPSLEDVFRRP